MSYTAVALMLIFLLLFLLLVETFLKEVILVKKNKRNESAKRNHRDSAADDTAYTVTQLHRADPRVLGQFRMLLQESSSRKNGSSPKHTVEEGSAGAGSAGTSSPSLSLALGPSPCSLSAIITVSFL